eukprot:gene1392-1513_t
MNGQYLMVLFLGLSFWWLNRIMGHVVDQNNSSEVAQKEMNIKVVYFAFIHPQRNWKFLIQSQLNHLKSIGLLDEAELCISVSTAHHANELVDTSIDRLQQAADAIDSLLKGHAQYRISLTLGNFYEYPGISEVWHWARQIASPQQARNTLFLYFHTKGMIFHGDETKRHDLPFFSMVIEPWKTVREHFMSDPLLNKAGFAISNHGWGWHNFWWARASYLQTLEYPIRNPFRFYYEEWLGRVQQNKHFRSGVDLHLDVNVTDPHWRHGGGYNFSTCADGWSMALGEYRRGIGADAACIEKLKESNKSEPLPVQVVNYAIDGQPCYSFC